MRKENWDRKLRREQLDRVFAAWRTVGHSGRPRSGWIRQIREAFGMSTRQLAARLDVSQPTVVGFEKGEAAGTITLETLGRVARALDCEVVYALVPRVDIDTIVRERARYVAEKHVRRVGHTMRLEDQATGPADRERLVDEEVQALLQGRLSRIWEDRP